MATQAVCNLPSNRKSDNARSASTPSSPQYVYSVISEKLQTAMPRHAMSASPQFCHAAPPLWQNLTCVSYPSEGTSYMAETSTDARPVLKVDHYVKRYGKKTSVDDVSIELNAGDIFGFVGHNGAGKTTLIRSIIGAQSIDGGSIEICGINVTKHPVDAKRLLAYVPDNPDVYPFMTGMQYLSYVADAYRVSDVGPTQARDGTCRTTRACRCAGRHHLLLLARHAAEARHHRRITA